MENYKRLQKIGKGNFGDVVLVERITDKKVIIYFQLPIIINLI